MPTHAHPEAVAGAAVIAYSVAYFKKKIAGELINHSYFLGQIERIAADLEANEMYKKIRLLRNSRGLSVGYIAEEIGCGGRVFEAVPSAIGCFLLELYNYEQVVVEAVNMGGDADSRAAMAGAVSGAFMGVEEIPSRWLEQLEDVEKIRGLAGRLCELDDNDGF